jgi:hypothetical protein
MSPLDALRQAWASLAAWWNRDLIDGLRDIARSWDAMRGPW